MSTDSQGRPLSDDGQWAWNGTEWVPAAVGAQGSQPSGDAGNAVDADRVGSGDTDATTIAPSPLAIGDAPAGGQPGYDATPPAPQAGGPGYGGAPAPGYGGAAPAYGQAPGPKKSRTPLIVAIVAGVIVIAAIVVVLVLFVFGGSDKKGPDGAYECTTPGSSGTGTITFSSGDSYALSENGKGGKYTKSDDKLTFKSGDLDKATGTYDSKANSVKIGLSGTPLTCKHK